MKGTDSAKVIQVIETRTCIGKGTQEDVCRYLYQYWNLEGKLLAEHDPVEEDDKQKNIASDNEKHRKPYGPFGDELNGCMKTVFEDKEI